jgi:transposase
LCVTGVQTCALPIYALIRVVDAWVESLAMKGLGFGLCPSTGADVGCAALCRADLLRLYLWGYLNAVRSSRALERECRRNVECVWLLGRLAPDHKTIANFRRDNTVALVAVCAAFVVFARQNRLVAGNTVAIDGTKVRAVASRKAIRGHDDLTQEAADHALDVTASYLQQLDSQDSQESTSSVAAGDVRAALAAMGRKPQMPLSAWPKGVPWW